MDHTNAFVSSQLREKAINALSNIISTRDAKERIFLGFEYRVVNWIREGYVAIVQRPTIQRKELSNNPFPLSWETIAGILAVRDSIAHHDGYGCCDGDDHGRGYTTRHCRCKALASVNEEFKEELLALEESPPCPAPPLPTTSSDHTTRVGRKKKR